MAAKVIQDGGKMGLTDIMQKGKELNRDNKRNIMKKKIGRVEQKLNQLKAKEDDNE